MKVEVGCGKKPRSGYVTCDVRNLPGVDYVCSADNLPFGDNSCDEIYSRHIIEHFTLKEFLVVLKEWNRVLKPGGTLYIICPNLLWHCRQVLEGSHESLYNKARGQNARYWGLGSLYGWQHNEYDVHKFGYYFELIRDIVEDFGFSSVEDLTNDERGLEHADFHLEVRAVKVSEAKQCEDSKFFTLLDVEH